MTEILIFAFVLDILLGDPVYKFHPVRLIGKWIRQVETVFFRYNITGITGGILFWFVAVIPVCLVYFSVSYALIRVNNHYMQVFWQSFVVYSCIAFRDMISHVKPVYRSLKKNNLAGARRYLGNIVGRDVEKLQKPEIIKASIESLSESFVDGFYAPVFWFFCGGIAGYLYTPHKFSAAVVLTLVFRITNTLDSMVGYRNDRYEKFGKFSARMDDILNFIPARLSIIFLLPGIFLSGVNWKAALVCFFRDRMKSYSPNAAHSMSAFAGALEISLGGKATYGGYTLDKPVLGLAVQKPGIGHLKKAMNIFLYSGVFTIIVVSGLSLFFKN